MDDTQSFDAAHLPVASTNENSDPVTELAGLDPADAPAAAERFAAELADELEAAGAPASEPVQMQADLGPES